MLIMQNIPKSIKIDLCQIQVKTEEELNKEFLSEYYQNEEELPYP